MTELHRLHTETIRAEVAVGVVDGLTAILKDKPLMEAFWRQGYEELAGHAAVGTSQWIGKRLLTSIIIAITLAGVAWIVRNGGAR